MSKSKHPIIGITTYGRNDDHRFTLPADYVDAVRRAGGIPILIPPGEERFDQLLPLLDGVILSGGGDIDPAIYGGSQHETIYSLDAERDQSELALTHRILAEQVPLLAICRGTQVLNVALGGTLIEHLPDEVGEAVAHRVPPRNPIAHPVTVKTDSQLAAIVGQSEIMTTSWHHQAIRQLAPSLNVVAYAPDGTIEAVEMPDYPWLIGVQWHPELSAKGDPLQQRLFDALVNVIISQNEKEK